MFNYFQLIYNSIGIVFKLQKCFPSNQTGGRGQVMPTLKLKNSLEFHQELGD